MSRTVFILMAAIVIAPLAAAETPMRGPVEIGQAEVAYVDSETPPTGAVRWQPVTLPHQWPRSAPPGVHRGWYRIALDEQPPAEPVAAYFWRFSMNMAVYLNDEFLGRSGRFDEPMSRNWNRPFLFNLPRSAWRSTDNYLYVRLGTYPGWGHLAPVVLGPVDALVADYERRFARQITLSQATFVVSLVTSLVAFSLWFAANRRSVYGYFALTCLAWSGYSLNLFIQDIPVSAKVWWWFVHSSVDWYGVLLLLFSHRLLDCRRPRIEWIALGFGCGATAIYALVPLETLSAINSRVHLVTVLMVFYVMVFAITEAFRRRTLETVSLSVCLAMIVFFAIHDLAMNALIVVDLWRTQQFWLQYSAPIMMLTLMAVLSRHYARTLHARLDAEQQVMTERERVFRDIHDDIGSRMLSLVYAAENDRQADIAREALRDVRFIVSGARNPATGLAPFLEQLQAEARERCREAAVPLQWAVDVGGDFEVDANTQYHLQRTVRELITNALKHSQCEQIVVECSVDAWGEVELAIRSDGEAAAGPLAGGGTGLAGLEARVIDIGGRLESVRRDDGWSTFIRISLGEERKGG